MVGRGPDALVRDRLACNTAGKGAADTDTRVGKAPPLPSVATHPASLVQRSSVAHVPAHSSTNVLSFAHPFGCDILEDFSIRFRRGRFYIVTTRGHCYLLTSIHEGDILPPATRIKHRCYFWRSIFTPRTSMSPLTDVNSIARQIPRVSLSVCGWSLQLILNSK